MKEINLDEFEVYEDPRWPEWTKDPAVWDYLEANYGVAFGGWWDDGGEYGDAPPLLTFVKVSPERVRDGR